MEPATGVRRIKLAPDQTVERVTATDDLFVLAHLGVPRIDPAHWSLTIDGLVRHPITLTLETLMARPKTVIEAVHQCCGNPVEPKVPTRRVANVRWGGVDLALLLDEAGIGPNARFLWSYGSTAVISPVHIATGISRTCHWNVSKRATCFWPTSSTVRRCRPSTASRCGWWCRAITAPTA
jgi:hypothetical protein